MKYPITSILLAFILFLSFFAMLVFYHAPNYKAEIEVDATMIDKLSRPKQKTQQIPSQDLVGEKSIAKNQKNSNQIATVTSRPLPEIPEDLRQEAFNSYAIARFYIAADGDIKVELIKHCSNPRLNKLLLQSLQKWKFSPASFGGVPVDSVQDIKVNFKVE